MANTSEMELWRLVNKAFQNSCEKFGDIFAKDVTRDLLANGVTVLPCKIGDTVWAVRYYGKTPVIKKCVVSEMMYLEDMRLGIAVKSNNRYSVRGFWGKNIFATREECEAALGGADNEQTY